MQNKQHPMPIGQGVEIWITWDMDILIYYDILYGYNMIYYIWIWYNKIAYKWHINIHTHTHIYIYMDMDGHPTKIHKNRGVLFFFSKHLQHAQVASPGGWTSYRLQGPHRCPFWEVTVRIGSRIGWMWILRWKDEEDGVTGTVTGTDGHWWLLLPSGK